MTVIFYQNLRAPLSAEPFYTYIIHSRLKFVKRFFCRVRTVAAWGLHELCLMQSVKINLGNVRVKPVPPSVREVAKISDFCRRERILSKVIIVFLPQSAALTAPSRGSQDLYFHPASHNNAQKPVSPETGFAYFHPILLFALKSFFVSQVFRAVLVRWLFFLFPECIAEGAAMIIANFPGNVFHR